MRITGHLTGVPAAALALALGLGAHTAFVSRDVPPSASAAREDVRHMLYEAAWSAQDNYLRDRVMAELGLVRLMRDGETWYEAQGGPEATRFMKEHAGWAAGNVERCRQFLKPEAAREYIRAQSHCCP